MSLELKGFAIDQGESGWLVGSLHIDPPIRIDSAMLVEADGKVQILHDGKLYHEFCATRDIVNARELVLNNCNWAIDYYTKLLAKAEATKEQLLNDIERESVKDDPTPALPPKNESGQFVDDKGIPF